MDKDVYNLEPLRAGRRTYFFDIKITIEGKRYLKITESQKRDGKRQRNQILIFEEDIEGFSKCIAASMLNFFKANEDETDTEMSHMEKTKLVHENAYEPWTEELDQELEYLFCQKHSIKSLAGHFKRNEGAIRSRIKKLGLHDKYPN